MNRILKRVVTPLLLLIVGWLLLSATIFDIDTLSHRLLGRFMSETSEIVQGIPNVPASEVAAAQEMRRIAQLTITEEETQRIITHMGSLGSRVVGYPGNQTAYTFVRNAFEEVGLQDVTTDSFQVTVPIDHGARLTLTESGETIPLYAFWPNHVRTPTLPRGGVTGRLIYGRKGNWEDIDGKPVDGNIILLDFDSFDRYLNIRMLGARVILFFDNGLVSRGEAEEKIEEMPLNIPRYWVERENALRLLKGIDGMPEVHVEGRMTWETLETWNVYGTLPGLDEPMPSRPKTPPSRWKDKVVVVEAYYDAISVVPSLAPGAESASGIAALLQIARALKAYGPKYTFLFLATSGHFETQAGTGNFLYRHARTSKDFLKQIPVKDRKLFDLFVGLDLSSGNDQLSAICYDQSMRPDEAIRKRAIPYARRLTGYANAMFGAESPRWYADAIVPSQRTWESFLPAFLILDHGAVTRVGLKGISFVTPNDARSTVDTPADLPDKVRMDRVTTQAKTAAGLLMALSRDPRAFEDINILVQDMGHDLTGKVVEFNRKVDFFTPKAPIPGAIVACPTDFGSYSGVRTLLTTITDKDGRFLFQNVPSVTTLFVRSYTFNDDGEIVYAPDWGQEGKEMFPLDVANTAAVNACIQVLFPCRALDLMETINPLSLTPLSSLTVLGPDNSTLRQYGKDFFEGGFGRAGVAYAKPGTRVKIVMGTSSLSTQYLLTNPPDEMFLDPPAPSDISEKERQRSQGQGYLVDQGLIKYPFYRSARDLWVLDDVRLNGLIRQGVKNDRATQLHNDARIALLEARQAIERLDYTRFVALSREAWGLEVRAYPDIKGTADDTVKGVIFYFFLVLPFAYFMERLLFSFPDIRKQMAAFAGIFVVVFLILQSVHPAFKLSMTPYIVFLAFIILALGAIVIVILTSKFDSEMKQIKQKRAGIHDADIGRLSATGVAINLGISNLRKRKLRTGLTIVTLIFLTFSVLSFTSYSTVIRFYRLSRPNRPSYQGAMIRDPSWRRLNRILLKYIESAFRDHAKVVPRAWFMPSETDARVDIRNPDNGRESFVFTLLGLHPAEHEVTGLDHLLIGSSRWFEPGERLACILPTRVAERLGIGPDQIGHATVQMLGTSFRVIGLIDSDRFDEIRDLDNEPLTPVSFITQGPQQTQAPTDPTNQFLNIKTADHLGSHNTLILPYDYTLEIEGRLRSVAMIPSDSNDPEKTKTFYNTLEAFLSRVFLAIFVGRGENVTVYSSIGVTSVSGLKNLIVPILIAALIVLNTMMGAVYERFREIGVYSSVGLAPSHIAALFIAEASVFATVGVVMGYLLGQAITMVLQSFHLLGGLSLNYSSMSAVFSSLIVMVIVILSAVYPAKKAAEMSVQDVTRRWELPAPVGDMWRFEFPFTVSRLESLAVCAYLVHVFQSHEHGVAEEFTAEETSLSAFAVDGYSRYRVTTSTWLAPFDLGVSQSTTLEVLPAEDMVSTYRIEIILHRKSGDLSSWVNLNREFLKVLRKRFLVWRTMGQSLKDEYAREGERQVLNCKLKIANCKL